jgi:DNA-binding transcriptional LysR family regulator
LITFAGMPPTIVLAATSFVTTAFAATIAFSPMEDRLVRALADWCPPFAGYHLYYPSRRQPTPAFNVFVEALRYRE